MDKTITLDEKDKLLLEELQKNCKQTVRELSKKTGIPKTTINHRVRKLERHGVIKNYAAILDLEKVGLESTAFILLDMAQYLDQISGELPLQNVADSLAKYDEISEVYTLAGEYDMLLKVHGKNERDIAKKVLKKIANIKGVDKSITIITFYTGKNTQEVCLR